MARLIFASDFADADAVTLISGGSAEGGASGLVVTAAGAVSTGIAVDLSVTPGSKYLAAAHITLGTATIVDFGLGDTRVNQIDPNIKYNFGSNTDRLEFGYEFVAVNSTLRFLVFPRGASSTCTVKSFSLVDLDGDAIRSGIPVGRIISGGV